MGNEKLTLDEFAEYVKNNIKRYMDEVYADATFGIKPNVKPGGVTLTGIELHRHGEKVSGIFYLDAEYERYLRGEDIDYLTHGIAQRYAGYDLYAKDMYAKPVFDWNFAKNHIVSRLISMDRRNQNVSIGACPVVKIPYTDIGFVYYIEVSSDDGTGTTTCPVGYNMFEKWGISLSELDEAARANNPSLRPQDIFLANADMEDMDDFCPMYIATNANHFHGDIVILYPGVYEEICKKVGDDVYILPTSVHECSCIPKSKANLYGMRRLLESINRSHPDEVLSNQVFVMENGRLKKARKQRK